MTLICGVNLCDRIYLVADTRLTRTDNKTGILYFDDNLAKIEGLSKNIAVAAAGDAKLAAFLITRLYQNTIMQKGIRFCRERIAETLKSLIDEYLKSNSYTHATLIFAGLDNNDKKSIDTKLLMDSCRKYQEKRNMPMNMKDIIFKAFQNRKQNGDIGRFIKLNVSDSLVFAVKIIMPSDLKIVDAEWGDYLAYGPDGLNKEHLPDILFEELEIASKPGIDGFMPSPIFQTANG